MSLCKWIIGFVFISSTHFVFADKGLSAFTSTEQETQGPWFTGPLLTPSGHIIPGGYYNIEPYTFVNVINGAYDRHWHAKSIENFYNVVWEVFIQIGLTEWMDFQIAPEASWNSTKGVSSLVVNDPTIIVDFQLFQDTKKPYIPAIKLGIQEIFPLGKFQRLDPEMLSTDIGGAGAYSTGFSLAFSSLFHLKGVHYLSLRWNGFYTISTDVHVKGLNAYGGAKNTKGTIRPGDNFGYFIGLELSLTKNWVFALDIAGEFKNKSSFSGKRGTTSDGVKATVGLPSSASFSLAPAFEYNFSENLGIIAGSEFTVGGRNTARFASGIIAINYYGPSGVPVTRFHSHGGGAH